ncbi:MAG: nitroreductase family protein [Patescibacteria group bacterium]
MDLIKAIKNRRSVRTFQHKPVARELIEKLIESAICAPSACNIQGWKFIVVDNQDVKKSIVDAGGSVLIEKAPLGILVLYNNRTHNVGYRDYIQSASAAIENLLLTATSEGLGACWICHLPRPGNLRKIFNIPKSFSPIAYLLLGYPENQPQAVPRKYRLDEVMAVNKFSPNWPRLKVSWLGLKIKRLLIAIYNLMPTIIKKKFLNKLVDKNFVKKFEN